ncbi:MULTISPECIES: SRPBCC family protein [Flagellimonas]|uniref:Activator of HSP90 ATPase n=1 Tax=Flagellimonas hadalis TaxID=2597517 RepID=A0A5N5IVU8_9FLAO|nr:SRPBCC family protein [Allomuricauda hadalis]KAB5487539.1 activator of HSP90 ATPase [Allomuricauda hadalis]RUA16384.1 MAG: activator of HSP90 ATPase [Flavobacteriia bacterium]
METHRITVKAMVKNEVERVWECWTHPEHITQWNFAADSWCCPRAENDLKVGGRYMARMEAKDGSFGFDFEAIYDEVVRHKKISYTMMDGRQATTTFENSGNGTLVTTVFDPEDQNPLEMQEGGWQAILNNFKTYVEG